MIQQLIVYINMTNTRPLLTLTFEKKLIYFLSIGMRVKIALQLLRYSFRTGRSVGCFVAQVLSNDTTHIQIADSL